MIHRITVNGIPAPQGSKRHVGRGIMVESSKKVRPWRDAVRTEVQAAMPHPLPGPVAVEMIFRLPRPAGHYRTGRFAGELKDSAPHYPDKKPDLDKLIRSTSDGLKEGGAFHDDSQIVTVQAFKIYARLDEAPGVDISITLA